VSGPAPIRWRRAVGADLRALELFLRSDEEKRVGFSGRLIHEAGASLKLPSPLRGAVWLAARASPEPRLEPVSLVGAVLCHSTRLVFPIFPDADGDRDFALLASSFSPASAIGLASDVERYRAASRREPLATVAYRLMSRSSEAWEAATQRPAAAGPQGLVVRRARGSDLAALLPLQEAYEIEEVLTPIHRFNGSACKASLARSLDRQLVYLAEEGGTAVAKAATNARGFAVDQIGGVYTLPSRRGRGLARALMEAILDDIGSQGRRPALFVKPENVAAIALYRGLGFEEIGDFRADYFEA
jgi:ribosomal protein S18 acetylase RimI-like enzyme